MTQAEKEQLIETLQVITEHLLHDERELASFDVSKLAEIWELKNNMLKLIPINKKSLGLLPQYGTFNSACFDVCSDISERKIKYYTDTNENYDMFITNDTLCLKPGYRSLIPTGFIFITPPEYSMRLHPRSGNAWKHGVTLMNGEGIIDSDYPNETFVMLHNTSKVDFIINHGDKVAQAELVKTIQVKFELLPIGSKFENQTDRIGGFGSTDKSK